MSETTIEWTDYTWNPWHGCRKVSAGCANCYMYRQKKQYGQDPTVVVRSKTKFSEPLKWKEPKRVFTCSWSDFFIEEADAWRDEAWEIIRQTPHLTYQILTKRPERMAGRLPWGHGTPWANVWLGVSVEDQAAALKRIPILLDTPAVMRFLSCEPLLGPLDLHLRFLSRSLEIAPDHLFGDRTGVRGRIHWVIAGGESGPKARPMNPEWARMLAGDCQSAGVPFFFKQWGEWQWLVCCHVKVGKKKAGRLLDGKEWNQFPGEQELLREGGER